MFEVIFTVVAVASISILLTVMFTCNFTDEVKFELIHRSFHRGSNSYYLRFKPPGESIWMSGGTCFSDEEVEKVKAEIRKYYEDNQ